MTLGPSRLWMVKLCCVFGSLVASCALPPPATGDTKDRITESDQTAASKRANVRMELASAYFSRGQLTTALDEVKQALAVNPNLGEAYNLRGLIYSGLGDDVLAQESYRRALQINPNDGDSMHNYGWHLCQQKQYDAADELFRRAMALPQYFGTSRTLRTIGVCQARAGKWAEAEATLTRAYERDPANPATAINLGAVLLRRGEPERARFYVRRVNSVADQSSAETLWLAARIEMKLGNRQAANEFGLQLRNRFPQSRESAAFDRGQFDE